MSLLDGGVAATRIEDARMERGHWYSATLVMTSGLIIENGEKRLEFVQRIDDIFFGCDRRHVLEEKMDNMLICVL